MAEIIREVVSQLRRQRLQNAGARELVRYLQALGVDDGSLGRYLKEAFCLPVTPRLLMLQRDRSGAFLDKALDAALGPPIDAARDIWTVAGPYPDLIRRRDRYAFKAVADKMELIIFVRAADPSSEQYVARPGYRPAPPWLEDTARATPPHEGLIAADPGDSALMQRLRSAGSSLTYAEYRQQLEDNGFAIGSPANGYIVRDRSGAAFYPGYRLHGVYSAATGADAWTPAQGEKIRAALNLHLCEELVQCGPSNIGLHRVAAGEEGQSRCFPLLMFDAGNAAYVVPDAAHLAAVYSFRKILPESPASTDLSLAGEK